MIGCSLAHRAISLLRGNRVALRAKRTMRAFFTEPDAIKRDEIAARQLRALRQHHTGKLRLFDSKDMFLQMKDYA
jgi:hypothetical protein